MASPTGLKGQQAELAVAYDLSSKLGYTISWPVANDVFDLVASRGEEVRRVQVKTVRRRWRNGVQWIVMDLSDGKSRRYEPGKIDLFAVYDPLTGHIQYITYDELNGKRELWVPADKWGVAR